MNRLCMRLIDRVGNEKGSMMLIGYFIIVVLLTLGAAFVLITNNESRIAERQRRYIVALHIAEAGIERAFSDLRLEYANDPNDGIDPSWGDGEFNGILTPGGPSTAVFYDLPYAGTNYNGGSYAVDLMNVIGTNDEIWVRSVGTLGDISRTILVYTKIRAISPWDNAIFAGAGAAGTMVNGNVNIRGSVHILGTGLTSSDYAVDLGGTAELIGNDYDLLDPLLEAKVPLLPQVDVNGELVETLSAELRVKRGLVGLSGSATAGKPDNPGDSEKETIDGSYVTDGFGGTKGTANVYSDNGWSNGYDLGEAVRFPSLSDPHPLGGTIQSNLKANALVLTNEISNITPNSSFNYSGPSGSIKMTPVNNSVSPPVPAKLEVSGIVYVDGNNNVEFNKAGSDKLIEYVGKGTLVVTGSAQFNVNLVTQGNDSFPTNILGIMTPNNVGFNEANIDVMGVFYAENQVVVQKQTDIMGTIVANYFNMGTNVPSIYQVPATADNLPPGMVGDEDVWVMSTVSWQLI